MTVKNKMVTVHGHSLEMLKDFGLSSNEALVYIYLLERGAETGGSKIAIGTKLHRQYVYISISGLTSLGLVEAVSYGKQKKYKAVAPSQIEKIAKKKVFEAESLVKELNTFSTVGHEQDFEVIQGREAIKSYEIEYVLEEEAGQNEYIIGGNSAGFADLMGDILDEYLRIKDKKGIKVFYLGSTKEKMFYESYKKQKNFQQKFVDTLPSGVVHMVIRKNAVLFFSFMNPPLLYVIKSPVVAENYKDFFMMLWNMVDRK